ncbi:MAG TPA: hypothetical protein VM287_06315, partial [Egibacteraceae bacterium]|nr:hypothetical protein [Egibacteraceae bacterium]
MNRRLLLVAVLALGLVAALLPVTSTTAQAQAIPNDRIQVSEDFPLRHDDPRPTRGRDAVGVAVNPGDPDHIVMTNADLFHFTCEYHVSRDGGASWQSGILTAPEGFG